MNDDYVIAYPRATKVGKFRRQLVKEFNVGPGFRIYQETMKAWVNNNYVIREGDVFQIIGKRVPKKNGGLYFVTLNG